MARLLYPVNDKERKGANLIKIHRRSGKLSYLVYPGFDSEAHPALLRCIRLNLRTRQVECYDYAASANPPVLHRKETFLAPEHESYAKFRPADGPGGEARPAGRAEQHRHAGRVGETAG
jgi:DNA phosphorothioation-associated putative methyltransferase